MQHIRWIKKDGSYLVNTFICVLLYARVLLTIWGSLQVNGGAGQKPLPIPQDQPGGAGGGTMAEAVQGLGQQVTFSQQVNSSQWF